MCLCVCVCVFVLNDRFPIGNNGGKQYFWWRAGNNKPRSEREWKRAGSKMKVMLLMYLKFYVAVFFQLNNLVFGVKWCIVHRMAGECIAHVLLVTWAKLCAEPNWIICHKFGHFGQEGVKKIVNKNERTRTFRWAKYWTILFSCKVGVLVVLCVGTKARKQRF